MSKAFVTTQPRHGYTKGRQSKTVFKHLAFSLQFEFQNTSRASQCLQTPTRNIKIKHRGYGVVVLHAQGHIIQVM